MNVKAVVAAFNQEKALVGAFSVITNLRMELFEALMGNLMVVSVEECSSRALVSRYGQAVVALKIFALSVEK